MSATPTIVMQQVESSQFAAIGHVPELSLLAIKFHPKKKTGESDIYHYQNVSAEMFAEFLGADSQGSFFIQRIKKFDAQFPYTKVDQTQFNHTAPQPVVNTPAESVAAPALTKELLAVALNGRSTPFDLTAEERAHAKAAGLVVIFGAGGYPLKLRGAIPDYFRQLGESTVVIANVSVELLDGGADVGPIYRTTVPHATFDIMEDGIVYCRGIVISVVDLGGAA
ncbi:KTSC domain-containing protein [Duganella sp. FT80W]|uniref:KTSC domain-containing protein n=1 Tax=Duganella guangzhouensis TaxID=2666084 RepID=A0A6I2KSK3_9BURK|nr:KTSC domain-containing protein [Duganella guangzhouensis]MRW88815.1 KTSC domain-containing protein [Duganella guangzhouensis]